MDGQTNIQCPYAANEGLKDPGQRRIKMPQMGGGLTSELSMDLQNSAGSLA
jgi:hypothetical protein